MPYVIASPCIDIMDQACVEECPVDCIYEGERKLYINPKECIDCGACEPVCPVEAISQDRRVADERRASSSRTTGASSSRCCPGGTQPLGAPGGAAQDRRPSGIDTPWSGTGPEAAVLDGHLLVDAHVPRAGARLAGAGVDRVGP